MADILITEEEFAAIKDLVAEAQATRGYFEWLSSVARRITRDDIAIPRLRTALMMAEQIDLENPRRLETPTYDDADGKRTRPTQKRRGGTAAG